MELAKVTDITIPEGNVIKIQETATGRVLWEKKKAVEINPNWQVAWSSIFFRNHGWGGSIRCVAQGPTNERSFQVFAAYYTGHVSQISSADYDQWGLTRKGSISSTSIGFPLGGEGEYMAKLDTHEKILAVTDKVDAETGMWLMLDCPTGKYYFARHSLSATENELNELYEVNTSCKLYANAIPINDTSITITYSPDREEYLITGLDKGSCLLPKGFTSSTPVTYTSGNKALRRTIWVSDKNKYYGSTGTNGYVYSSSDGITWTSEKVLNSGNVLSVEYLKWQKKLCAISSNSKEIAISVDGQTWEIKTSPFSKASVSACSDDYSYLCIVDNRKAYLTNNFSDWETADIPSGITIQPRDLVYVGNGVFICLAGDNDVAVGINDTAFATAVYILSLSAQQVLSIPSGYKLA